MKKTVCLLLAIGTVITLCSCAANPKKDVVTSKGDGAFETRVLETAAETHDPTETQAVSHTEEFYCTNESVLFRMTIDEQVTAANMPVVEVAPRFITEEEAKHAARVLFGDVEFLEKRPRLSDNYSKSELREMIERWEQYTDEEIMKRLVPSHKSVSEEIEFVKGFIEKYAAMIETAPDEDLDSPCLWTYRDEGEYWNPPEEGASEWGTDAIGAVTEINGIPYQLTVSKRDREDYKVSGIWTYIYDPISPAGYDGAMYMDKLKEAGTVTQEQLDTVTVKAQTILEEINLGEWKIDHVSDLSQDLCLIRIKAVPVFNGVAAVWRKGNDRDDSYCGQ